MKSSISFILIALSVGLFFFYVRPQYTAVMSLRTQITTYTNAIASAKQVKTQSDALLQQYNNISDVDKAKLSALVPPKFDIIKVTSDITTIAAQHGIVVKSVAAGGSSTGDTNNAPETVTTTPVNSPYKTTSVSFSATGQYKNFLAFLKDIESNIELMDVRKISVGSGSVSDLKFDVSLDTYSLN